MAQKRVCYAKRWIWWASESELQIWWVSRGLKHCMAIMGRAVRVAAEKQNHVKPTKWNLPETLHGLICFNFRKELLCIHIVSFICIAWEPCACDEDVWSALAERMLWCDNILHDQPWIERTRTWEHAPHVCANWGSVPVQMVHRSYSLPHQKSSGNVQGWFHIWIVTVHVTTYKLPCIHRG